MLVTFLKDVCSYFARSSKRIRDFALIQEAVKVVNQRILKMACMWYGCRSNIGAVGTFEVVL